MSALFDVAGRTAIVTGASSGLGERFARALGAAGANVVVVARREDRLRSLAADLGEERTLAIGADVRDSAQADALVAFALKRFGRLDVMVNNAGIAIGLGPVVELSDEDWEVNLAVMATGVFNCSRAAARALIAQGEGGRIITVASQAGKLGQPWLGAYSAAKFAAIGLTQVLAHELGPHDITVNAVCPGTVLTPLLDLPGGIFDVYPARAGITREQYERKVLRTIPLGRYETPEDVAGAVSFLASDDAAYAHGTVLVLDGGVTA